MVKVCNIVSMSLLWLQSNSDLVPLSLSTSEYMWTEILFLQYFGLLPPKIYHNKFQWANNGTLLGLSIFVVPYSLWCRLTDLLSTGSNQCSTQQIGVHKSQATKFVTVVCNISSIIIAFFFSYIWKCVPIHTLQVESVR